MIAELSPLEAAKQAITIPEAWHRQNYEGEPRKSCRCPWREDRNASFSVSEDGRLWHDFGANEGGDIVSFVAKAKCCTMSEAARVLIEWHRGMGNTFTAKTPQTRAEPPAKTRRPLQVPTLERGSINELSTLADSRKLPVFVALEHLHARGLFGFCAQKGVRAWILTDKARRNAQARPLYPQAAGWPAKALTLSDGDTSWPIGAACMGDAETVFLCEGMPDLIAVATAVWLELDGKGFDRYAFACMTGAAMKIAEDALPLFQGKTVQIVMHNDKAGKDAAARWWRQLEPHAATLNGCISALQGEDANDAVCRHWQTFTDEEGGITKQTDFITP